MILFAANDGGRSKSKRKKQYNDCAVRALAIAYNIPYDIAFDLMKTYGKRVNNDGVIDKDMLRVFRIVDSKIKVTKPRKIIVSEFVELFSTGTYMLSLADHITVLKDGILHEIDMAAKHILIEQVEIVYKPSKI